ncbi:MAG: RdgB/HAM1 family non-canonical purine NTP pyrophosphatase [Lysobacterales bacterium]|nr:RdgB/HAM1 family non-canonical purine NTP pyrophosphatase [Xanthomonadales bacterium]MCB1613615.1 RdgB/HAM1 family non-canonical purine NTP pyrophosphatase [Xanthomonadales bacterium]
MTEWRDVVLASHNQHKLEELRSLLADLPWRLHGAGELAIPEPDEPACTFVENALIKARHAARLSGRWALADDSGIVVDALAGAPGVHSARFAGPKADAKANIDKLLKATETLEGAARSCRFVCVIVLMRSADDPSPIIAEGVWTGRLSRIPRGKGGFGYDPVFLDASSGLSAAELSPEQKHTLSHRGKALAQLRARLAG